MDPAPAPLLPVPVTPPPSPAGLDVGTGDGAVPGWPPEPAGSRPEGLWILAVAIAACPLVVVLLLSVGMSSFMAPLTDGVVNVVGLPVIVPFAVLFVGMVFVAGLLGRSVGSGLVGVVVAALWFPVGLFLAILGPALVLIYQGMTMTAD